jgi:tripartite ATP-independent transporter DctM subunit
MAERGEQSRTMVADKRLESPAISAVTVEQRLYKTIEVVTVGIVAAEILLLFSSAVARYVFVQPLHWADELAGTLLVWMTMLGSVLAFRRDEHLRLTIAVRRLPPAWQPPIYVFATCAVLAFIAVTIWPMISYVREEWTYKTLSLEIPVAVELSALPIGFALIFAVVLLALLREAPGRQIAGALAAIALLVLAIWAARPLLAAIGNYNLIFFFVILVVGMILLSVPIGFAFAIAALVYLISMTDVPLTIVGNRIAEGMGDPILTAIPLFIYLGSLMVLTGLARVLVEFLLTLFGHLRGGVSFVLIGAMYLVSGISGAKAADMAAIAPVLLPEMERRGSKRSELVALMAATGAMSETIPPSIVLIATGAITGISIRSLFIAGFVPAAICALCLVIVVMIRSRKEDTRIGTRPTSAAILKTLVAAIPALFLIVLIRTLVVEGVTTATEVSAFAIAYTLVLGALYRSLRWRELYTAAVAAASLSGAIILILGLVTAMSWALTRSGFSFQLSQYFLSLPGGVVGFMIISILIFVVLGSFLEGIPALVLIGPVLFPIAQEMGISEVHYAIVAILAMGVGLFAPPFGIGFYYSSAIGGADPDQVLKHIWLYLGFVLIGVVLVAAIPWFSTGLL